MGKSGKALISAYVSICIFCVVLLLLLSEGIKDERIKQHTPSECSTLQGCEKWFFGGMTEREYEQKEWQKYLDSCEEDLKKYGQPGYGCPNANYEMMWKMGDENETNRERTGSSQGNQI